MLTPIITAIRTLTILPIPGKDTDRKSNSLPWFPAIGLILGLLFYVFSRAFIFISSEWYEGTAIIAIMVSIILTRGFHLDGLADFADGFGGGHNRSQTLSIMKDSCTGAFGVLAIVIVLLIKYISLLRIIHMGHLYLIIPVYIVSRAIMVPLAVFLPYAREEGGTANPFVSNARLYHFLGAMLLSCLLLFAFSGLLGLILLLIGLISCCVLGFWFHVRIKGVTGDLLGASCEIVEAGLFFFCAIAGHWFYQYLTGKAFSI